MAGRQKVQDDLSFYFVDLGVGWCKKEVAICVSGVALVLEVRLSERRALEVAGKPRTSSFYHLKPANASTSVS